MGADAASGGPDPTPRPEGQAVSDAAFARLLAGLPRIIPAGPPPAPSRAELATPSGRAHLLLRARGTLAVSLDPDDTLATLTDLVVPALADWCAVDLAEEGGVLHRVAVGHADPRRLGLLRTLCGRYHPDPAAPGWPLGVAQTGRSRHTLDAEASLAALSGDPGHLRILKEVGAASVICVPLVARERVIGALTLARTDASAPLKGADAAMARILGSMAGIALLHSRLHQEVQAASRAKDEFMAMLGHELRNPISAILSAVGVLARPAAAGDVAARARTIIGRQARQLGRIVDDLLDVARLTSGKITLQLGPVNLGELAERCLENLRVAGAGDRHDLTLDAKATPITGDAGRLEQVVGNLLDNALKYTPPGGRIVVAVRPEGSHALLRVEDTGIGIASEVLSHVFDVFAQGPQSSNRPRGGLGLGLTLVRRLVELHGGAVQIESPGRGGGTRVTIRLPLAEPATSAAAPSVAEPPAATLGRRILLVEDHQDAREALRWLLEAEGHEVTMAADGHSAVELALATRPDVVLVDIGLPGLDGYEVARRLRAAANGRDLRLIALTGYGQPADRTRAREAGFDAHLVKPVDADQLARLLTGAAARSRDAD
ncbi:MAG TPA: ATP-binding protein [Methylomirabilota bacterium]|nr:ATP-binding protein [Methylomirabilota bacterium]